MQTRITSVGLSVEGRKPKAVVTFAILDDQGALLGRSNTIVFLDDESTKAAQAFVSLVQDTINANLTDLAPHATGIAKAAADLQLIRQQIKTETDRLEAIRQSEVQPVAPTPFVPVVPVLPVLKT